MEMVPYDFAEFVTQMFLWEDVPWCVSLTLLMQRAQGEKHGVYSVPFFPHVDEEAGE